MPVTKTAKRALRVSQKKKRVNDAFVKQFEISLREAKKKGDQKVVAKAMSLADRAAKRRLIHKNKAARIKSYLAKLIKPAGVKSKK